MRLRLLPTKDGNAAADDLVSFEECTRRIGGGAPNESFVTEESCAGT